VPQHVEVHGVKHARHRTEQGADEPGDDACYGRYHRHRQPVSVQRFPGREQCMAAIGQHDAAQQPRQRYGIENLEEICADGNTGCSGGQDAPQIFPGDMAPIGAQYGG